MITNLRIRNVALIDEVEVAFGDGLNVLTGETGAGKSIVVDSINFLLGERPVRDFIRSGAESAVVEGLVEIRDDRCLHAVETLDITDDLENDRQLMIQRTLYPQGRSVCRVNGRTVTVGMLKELSSLLVDVHGQHEHQSLLDTAKQLQLLDMFCGTDMASHKQTLEALLQQYRENGKALKALSGVGGQRETQLDIWQYQIDEIKKVKLKTGEEDELLARRTRLNGLDKLSRNTTEALSLLAGGDINDRSASDQVGRAIMLLTEIGRLDSAREAMGEMLSEAATLLSEVVAELRAYADELDADPNELERIETRLDTIYRLKQKYGPTVEHVLAHYEKLTTQMERLLGSDAEIKRLQTTRKALIGEITTVCGQMSALRKQQAAVIQGQITEVLKDLGMKHARFEIVVEQKKEFGIEGNDRVEFLISPNPGEPVKALTRIASGGEMSRVMLAVKTVLADADKIETLIFDEIDTGVSGRTAQQVAEKLMIIARGRQILCITHLPQIAAMADTHFLIEKKTDGLKTVTSVRAQKQDEIIQELARLIGGAKITDATYMAAGEMKQMANQIKTENGC